MQLTLTVQHRKVQLELASIGVRVSGWKCPHLQMSLRLHLQMPLSQAKLPPRWPRFHSLCSPGTPTSSSTLTWPPPYWISLDWTSRQTWMESLSSSYWTQSGQ